MRLFISLARAVHWLTLLVFLIALSACGNDESLSGDPNSSETENALALRLGFFGGETASQISIDAISPDSSALLALSKLAHSSFLTSATTGDTIKLMADHRGVVLISEALIGYRLEHRGLRLLTLDSSYFESVGDTSDIVLSEGRDSLLLEDFEQPNDFGNLHDITLASYWWVSIKGGTSVPSIASEFGAATGPAISSSVDDLNLPGEDQVLHIQTTLDYEPALVQYGLDLLSGIHTEDDNSKYMDLSALDSIVLFVQGDGDFTFSLQSKLSGDGDNKKLLAANVQMNGDWQRVVLTQADFKLRFVSTQGTNTPDPAKILRDISSLVLEFEQSGNWQLNNIFLYGRFACLVGY